MWSRVFARAVFGLLVIATAGAFLVTQRLKREPPSPRRIELFSPTGDRRRVATVTVRLPRADRVTASVIDPHGDEVRRLRDDVALGPGPHRFRWDGRTDGGRIAPDGLYRVEVALRSQGRALLAPRLLRLDTTPPGVALLRVRPSVLTPGGRGRPVGAQVRFDGPSSSEAPLVRVFRTDRGRIREIDRFRGRRGQDTATWDATVAGRPVPDGVYAFSVTLHDQAGNAGRGAGGLPPSRAAARPGTGVTVRRLALSGPLEPVAAGSSARVAVSPPAARLDFRLDPVDGGRPAARGHAGGGLLVVRVPRRTRTGLYRLRVRAGRERAAFPLAVAGGGGPSRRPALLVVLPAIAWQGQNPVDDDGDGFPDTLDDASAVPLDRPLAGGRPPVGFADGPEPLLRLLDRQRAPYELTTDLALARGHGPGLAGRPGVLLAGAERWVPPALDGPLRAYVEGGGRVASFGVDALRRRVAVGPDRLSGPTPPAPADVFGERVAPLLIQPAPMVVFSDALGLLGGPGQAVGLFSRFEESRRLPPGARALTAAGRDPARPALVAYRLGRGLVVRVGTPAWGAQAPTRSDVAGATERIVALLSAGR